MEKTNRVKKTLAILLVVFLVISATAVAASAKFEHVTASFNANPTKGPAQLNVHFRDHSSSNSGINSWIWDFGDGSTSTLQNPVHKYKNAGIYTVVLTVTSPSGGTATYTKSDYITVEGITCDFKATSPTSGLAPLTITFQDLSGSDSGISSWLWDFGDGTTDNNQCPVPHTYTNPGPYTVTLTVTDGAGNQASEVKNDYVKVQ